MKLKKSIGKNQVIITALAVMIAVAGYINYSGNLREMLDAKGAGAKTVSADDISKNRDTDVIEDDSIVEPGTAVLTSSTVTGSIINEAKLNREQIRAKNTENLTNIVNDTAIDKASKTEAINELAKIAEYSEKEAAIELLLEAKGFNDVVASVAEDSVDIVINQQTLENSQKAQIEDIAKRKTGVTSDKITINVIK